MLSHPFSSSNHLTSSWRLILSLSCAWWMISTPKILMSSGKWMGLPRTATSRTVSQTRTARKAPTASAAPWHCPVQSTKAITSMRARSATRAWLPPLSRASIRTNVRARGLQAPQSPGLIQSQPLTPPQVLFPQINPYCNPLPHLPTSSSSPSLALIVLMLGGQWINKVNLCTCDFSLLSDLRVFVLFCFLTLFFFGGGTLLHWVYPLQCTYLEDTMDCGAWQAIVPRVTKSWTQLKGLSTHTHWVFVAARSFSSCNEQGLLSSCSEGASHWGDFSCCGAWVLEHASFSSCSTWAQ